MKKILMASILFLTVTAADGGTVSEKIVQARDNGRLAYERITADSGNLRVYNRNGVHNGFVVELDGKLLGYSPEGEFDIKTAPPALVAMLESVTGTPSEIISEDNGQWTPVAPICTQRGYVMWNQDSPFNDLCPEYEMGKRSPTGCVATAMAQVMYVNQWPVCGTGSHTYSPVILSGNTLTADFGSTEYKWDAMIPYYGEGLSAPGYSAEESRNAVAQLMLHCGVAVDMVYYSQSGALDYDVPPALTEYFSYDRGLAYRKRSHYTTREWLEVIHDDLEEGHPVLAYGKSTSGGHAYVFDGMDEDGFIHVNWGWGGMSNGYFNTSALTPAAQGIGGSDGGFNYSQSIITGVKPASEIPADYHVEITSTEALSAGSKKIANGADVKIKFTGKVSNQGWRESEFDYALVLSDATGKQVKIIEGPKGNKLAKDETGYAPDFGTVNFGALEAGDYILAPAVRMTGGLGVWIPVRNSYIGYSNILKVHSDGENLTFSSPDYFDLKASYTFTPKTIYSEVPALITTSITNEGDVEYHGEIRAVLMSGNKRAASTSNYIIDLAPGATTDIRFTDSFSAQPGNYQLVLVNDDGQKVSSPANVEVKATPEMGTLYSDSKVEVLKADPSEMKVKAKVRCDGFFQGLLYAFICNENGAVQKGCLYPEFISIEESGDVAEIILSGEFENGLPDISYMVKLATYNHLGYIFLEDSLSEATFQISGGSRVEAIETNDNLNYKYYDFNGFEVDPQKVKLYKRVNVK